MAEAVGYLGLGLMGTPMTRNLLKAGYPVVVWNRTRARAEALAREGAQVADSPAEVAHRARIVLACLADARAVEQVVTGPRGLLEAVGPGHVFVDMTTNSPPVSMRLAARLAELGAEMLDAPVSGADVGAIQGTLSIMVGGKPGVFQRVLPVFQVLGKRIVLMGERVGAGGYAKLANQIMVGIQLASMGEALVFGAKAGLDLNRLVEALSGGAANSEVLRIKSPKVLSGELTPGARATVQLKDLTYITESMASLGFSLPVTQLVRTLYQQLVEMGHGDEDHSAIVRVFEKLAGVEARARA
jgi:2-hydroxy-3-oxopropionate reductase